MASKTPSLISPSAQGVLDDLAGWKPAADASAADEVWLASFRSQTAALARFSGVAERLHEVRHVFADSPNGPLPIRIYRPSPGYLPVLLHIRGGGGIAGSLDAHDAALRALAKTTGWAVAAPDYRLAPEAPFPAQLDDSEVALRWLVKHGREWALDADRLVVSGDSIGGTLATALAVRARDAQIPLAGQILLFPNVDLRQDAPYHSRQTENGRIIEQVDLERQIDVYLNRSADRLNPEASPLLQLAPSIGEPILLVTCSADPLRDEGQTYGCQLLAAGARLHEECLEGALHAVLQMRGRVKEADTLFERISHWLFDVGGPAAPCLRG
ncbi:alpha/beta hydrolase [Brevundimonas sp. TWP2-3-2]|uniref:alpha/beta hydrolase n=1 Tax=unclassified Brevundimonas TaxID=2622653 RepID=UPI003CF0931D